MQRPKLDFIRYSQTIVFRASHDIGSRAFRSISKHLSVGLNPNTQEAVYNFLFHYHALRIVHHETLNLVFSRKLHQMRCKVSF